MAKIFISYRRTDSNNESRRIYDALVARFGTENIFRDKDRIPKGVDFRKTIEQYVFSSDEMLVLIGQKWLDIREDSDASKRRLDNPEDFVRIEIDMGLRHVEHITPVIVQNASMPNENELPRRLVQLGFQNAYFLHPDTFDADLQSLVEDIANRHSWPQTPEFKSRLRKNLIRLSYLVVLIAVLAVIMIAISLLTSNNGGIIPTQVAQSLANEADVSQGMSPDDARATGVAQAHATLTALAPTEISIVTPIGTPISSSDIQQTAQAEIFVTETIAAQTQSVGAQETQNTVLTEQFSAGSTATYIVQLSLTPPGTNTVTGAQTREMLEPERVALVGVTANEEWEQTVSEGGYERDFDGMIMVLVPSGCFEMGNDPDGHYWNGEEFINGISDGGIQCFEEPFWIGKYEVTNAQYGSSGYWSDDDLPRESLNWFEAQGFCESHGGRLPTEAEWEYTAHGPDKFIYPWGNEFIVDNVVYSGNSDSQTAPVGSRPDGVSWVGALDMSGNVWEWTLSEYRDYPYDPVDGRETISSDTQRVVRGGAFDYDAPDLRVANRYNVIPSNFLISIGFRCVRPYQ